MAARGPFLKIVFIRARYEATAVGGIFQAIRS